MDPNDDARDHAHRPSSDRNVRNESESSDTELDRKHFVELFDPSEVRRKLLGNGGIEYDGDDFYACRAESRPASDAMAEWEAKLRAILDDRRGPERKLLIADKKLLERLAALKSTCPGFDVVIDLILREAHLSLTTASPMRVPALLLLGPAGVGKTHLARQLAGALGVHFEFISGDLLSDRGVVTGLSASWRAAKPGKIATALLESPIASPLFVLDEVDKVNPINDREEPLAFLHTVLEQENAKKFTDEYLSFSMRADHCIWLLTANQANTLSPSVLDRLLVISIKAPDYAAMARIVRNIYGEANARHSNWFEADLEDPVIDTLAHFSPRKASQIIRFALGFAAANAQRTLTLKDVSESIAIIEKHDDAPRRMGFVAQVK